MSMAEQEKPEETAEGSATPAEGSAEQPAKSAAKQAPAERRPREQEIAPAGPATAVLAPRRQANEPLVSRRGILRIGFWSAIGAMVAGAAACGVDLLYPRGVTGFGGRVTVSPNEVPPPGGKVKIARGRFWLVNLTEEQGGPGLLALWWKCPHLGCTVPWKETFIFPDPTTSADKQGWFRCPCHGSTYTDAGIRVFGPAPRSLDTMELTVDADGRVSVETGKTTNGAPDNPDRAVRI